MQTHFKTSVLIATLFLLLSCEQKHPEFEIAANKGRNGSLDQINIPKQGLPFFTLENLNPVWDASTQPIVQIPNIEFIDQNGKIQSQNIFDHQQSLLVFFYTSCMGFCPSLIENIKQTERDLVGRRYRYIAISIDPIFDTSEKLKTFAKTHQLSSRWTLLTGSPKAISNLVRQTFSSQVLQKDSVGPRNFIHTGHVYFIDEQRRLRGIFNGTKPTVARDILTVLPAYAL